MRFLVGTPVVKTVGIVVVAEIGTGREKEKSRHRRGFSQFAARRFGSAVRGTLAALPGLVIAALLATLARLLRLLTGLLARLLIALLAALTGLLGVLTGLGLTLLGVRAAFVILVRHFVSFSVSVVG
jgi:hypothetical protein